MSEAEKEVPIDAAKELDPETMNGLAAALLAEQKDEEWVRGKVRSVAHVSKTGKTYGSTRFADKEVVALDRLLDRLEKANHRLRSMLEKTTVALIAKPPAADGSDEKKPDTLDSVMALNQQLDRMGEDAGELEEAQEDSQREGDDATS